ncbi:hypothetical protein ACN2XU_21000 [Primorskyibacter sp. 2E107]|uniref:hypothetical protein n=1 Tax=Primorskyibacter sp. 2E107 TaxID=3403458 RepID=UPI003AF684AE
MTHFSKTMIAALFATAIAAPAVAHDIESRTVALPVIGAGDAYEVVIKCHHGYALSGGVKKGKRIFPDGPLVVSGSYPKTTRSWAIELTNRSGRPTGAMETSATVYSLCGYHH